MIAHLLNRPCTITRTLDTDEIGYYGDQGTGPVEIETVCELQQQRRTEPDGQGELSDTTWLLVLPAGTLITTADTVTVDGQRYELIGDPWPARNPRTGKINHVETTARRSA